MPMVWERCFPAAWDRDNPQDPQVLIRNPARGADLSPLYDSHRGGRPVVSWGFLGLCMGMTALAWAFPSIHAALGEVEEKRSFWQALPSVFLHGLPGVPALLHLGVNSALILECGRPCERLLGSGRFLALCLASLGVNAGLQTLTGGVNGSSQVIWSWGPPLFVALLWARRQPGGAGGDAVRVRNVLIVMYVLVSLGMGILPYAAGWRGNPLIGFLMGNLFHISATLVGVIAALYWRRDILARLSEFGAEVEAEGRS